MGDDEHVETKYYKSGILRKVFRMTSLVLHLSIAVLAGFFYIHENEPIQRSDLVKHDWKYVEFIERIYNNRNEKGQYTLEMLGTDAVYKKGFKSDAIYFNSGKTADEVFQLSIDDDPPSITAKSFFEDISTLIEGASFASPLYLYKKNAQIYGLPGQLCLNDSVRVSDSVERDAIIGSKPPDGIGLFSRFCKPNIAPSIDYGYCFSIIQKHRYIMMVLGACTGLLSIGIPIVYSVRYMVRKSAKNTKVGQHSSVFAVAKYLHCLEDLHTFVDFVALVVFVMEVVDGFPSGFPNTRCPNSATSMYTMYMMFNTIFVLLCAVMFISILTWILDLAVRNIQLTRKDLQSKTVYWNTRQNELISHEYTVVSEEVDGTSQDMEEFQTDA